MSGDPEDVAVDYRLDAQDRIVSVGDTWLPFAVANDAQHLTPEAVVGQSVWGYITDPETRYIYRVILDSVRRHGDPISVPLRCDSPTLRRHLELTVNATGDGDLGVQTRLLRVEEREHVGILATSVNRSGTMTVVCSWCKKVKLAPDEWVEVEEAVHRLGLFTTSAQPSLTHGICSPCRLALLQALESADD